MQTNELIVEEFVNENIDDIVSDIEDLVEERVRDMMMRFETDMDDLDDIYDLHHQIASAIYKKIGIAWNDGANENIY